MIDDIVRQQRDFFRTGKTRDIGFRIEQLIILKQAIFEQQKNILNALKEDLSKPEFEAYATEIVVSREIDYAIKHIKSWTTSKRVAIPLEQFPGSAQVKPEPLGVVLIIGAWNYPFQLIISPLVGAIAAGNCAILKPSEVAYHTSNVLKDIIQKYFDSAYIAVIEGGIETTKELLDQKFDHIFFTGSSVIGKVVMAAAAKHLTPVTLELGGKSPCIVDSNIDLECTARRIIWGKFLNAGQTCIAPDYLLVDKNIKSALLATLKTTLDKFYGANAANSPDYARIINQTQFNRLVKLLAESKIIIGGETDSSNYYIAPTVIESSGELVTEEIFGPILPVIEYSNISEAIATINAQPKPLALYLFSRNQQLQEQVLRETSSGSVCINDTVMQTIVPSLPFGGVGNSGMGSYHGKAGFDTFSHYKSILNKSFWFDLKVRYAPYEGKLTLLKRILNLN